MAEVARKKKKLNKQQWKYILSIGLLVLTTVLTAYTLLSQGNFSEIVTTLNNAKTGYVALIIAITAVCWLIEGLVLMLMTHLYRKSYQFYQGVLNAHIGGFFSAITPFSTGGQFAQIYTFSRQGVRPADSASILVMLFIVSQFNVIFCGAVAMIFGYQQTVSIMQPIVIGNVSLSPVIVSWLGFGLNVWTLGSMVFMSYSKHFHHLVLNFLVDFGAKIHLVKDPVRKKTEFVAQTTTFRIEMHRLLQNFPVLIATLLLEFVKTCLFNFIPYLCGLALMTDAEAISALAPRFLDCMFGNAYVNMITAVVPIPGGSGGAEYAFYLIFTNIFKNPSVTSAANMLNRIITFYLPLAVGFLVFIFYRSSPKLEAFKNDSGKTLVDLQIIRTSRSQGDGSDPFLSDSENTPSLRKVRLVGPDEEVHSENTIRIDSRSVRRRKNGGTSADLEASENPVVKPGKKRRAHRKRASEAIEEEDAQLLSPEEVEKSFANIRKSLAATPKELQSDSSSLAEETKKGLADVYVDLSRRQAEREEDERKDQEIEEAIQKDLEQLRLAQERRAARRRERENAENSSDKPASKNSIDDKGGDAS